MFLLLLLLLVKEDGVAGSCLVEMSLPGGIKDKKPIAALPGFIECGCVFILLISLATVAAPETIPLASRLRPGPQPTAPTPTDATQQ